MVDAVLYALLCSCAISAVLVPAACAAIRTAVYDASARHTAWLAVLGAVVATITASLISSTTRTAPSDVPPHTGDGLSVIAAIVPADDVRVAIATLWLAGVVVQMIGVVRRLLAIRAQKRAGRTIDSGVALPRGARMLSADCDAPAAVGFAHPAVVLPRYPQLGTSDIESVITHEAAHLRRYDDVSALIFSLCAAVLWFNPLIRYVGRQLSLERELACDEAVVAHTGDARRYATLLYRMAHELLNAEPDVAWNGFVHSGNLATRVQRLLAPASRTTRPWPPILALSLVAAIVAGGIAFAAETAPPRARVADARIAVHCCPPERGLKKIRKRGATDLVPLTTRVKKT